MFEVKEIQDTGLALNPVIAQMSKFNHEQILFCNDNSTGLKAIIAVHNTVLGPAFGGSRMWMYKNEMEALNDVLSLSRGMTYKNSISGLNLGGRKAVSIGDSYTMKSEVLMRRFGKFVNSLAVKYITAEDVGISMLEMKYVKMETDHVVGLDEIYNTISRILKRSSTENIPTYQIANKLAEERIEAIGNVKLPL